MKEAEGVFDPTESVSAEIARDLTPVFANYGATENTILAAGIMVAEGNPVAPAILFVFAGLDYLTREYERRKPPQI